MDVAVNARFLLPGGHLEGIGRYTREVTEAMAREHPDVNFHLLFDRPCDDRYLSAPNLRPHVLPPPARHPVLFLWWFEVSVARWLRRNRPDVFFSPDGFTTLRTSVPRVTVVHDLAFEHFPDDVYRSQRLHYRTMTPRFVATSQRIVTVSEATKADLVDCYGTDPSKIAVAYPGVSRSFLDPVAPATADEARERLAGGRPFFLFVGAIQPRKNLPVLLRAFDIFKDRTGHPARLLIVGRQAWKTAGTAAALAAMRHRDDVVLTGALGDEDLHALYAGAIATVFVSLFEGFGMPVVEAMSSGGVAITSDVSSMPEAAGDAALLVDPRDPAAVAEAMRQLVEDGASADELRRRASARARRFRWDDTAATVWRQLEDAVNRAVQ